MIHNLVPVVVLSAVGTAVLTFSNVRLMRRTSSPRVAAKLTRSTILSSLPLLLIGPLFYVASVTGRAWVPQLWDAAMAVLTILDVAAVLRWRARREEAGLVLMDLGRPPVPNKLFAVPLLALLSISGYWAVRFPFTWQIAPTFVGVLSLVITIAVSSFTRLQICNSGVLHYTRLTLWKDIAGYRVADDGSSVTFERREISSFKINEIRCPIPAERKDEFFYALKSHGIGRLLDDNAHQQLTHVRI